MNRGDLVSLVVSRFEVMTGPLPATPRFVDDRLVDYGFPGMIYVRRKDLFSADDDECWTEFLVPGARWVHFSLLHVDDGSVVVTVRRGPDSALAGPRPAVNMSIGQRPARIMEEQ